MTVSTAVQDRSTGGSAVAGRNKAVSTPALTWLLRLAVVGVLVAATERALRLAELRRAFELVQHAGWPMAAVLLPTGLAMSLDARGLQQVLRTMGWRVAWPVLLPIRLAAEALVLAIPGGAFAAEAAKLGLLRRGGGVPLGVGGACLALCKACHIGGEALYLAVAAIVVSIGGAARAAHGGLSPWLLAAVGSLVVAGTSTALFMLLRDVSQVSRFVARLLPARAERLRRWAGARRAAFEQLDRVAQGFFAAPRSTRLLCVAPFALEWFVEGLETFLILRCLGASVGFGSAVVVDGVGSLLRAMAFFVPAGLGVQDAAQVALLAMLGVPDAAALGAALIIVKRTKEVFWLFTGLAIGAGKRKLWVNSQLEPAP
jgi:uncharacterized membrane protein YbhN (UPF0104 family)